MNPKNKEKDLCSRYTILSYEDGNILIPVVISNLMSATDKLVIKPYPHDLINISQIDYLNSRRFNNCDLIENGLDLEI